MSSLLKYYQDDDSNSNNSAEYDPSHYNAKFEDEDEEWGDVNSSVDYKSPIPVHPKPKPSQVTKKPEPIFSAPKPSLINQKYFNISSAKPEPKVREPSLEDKLAEMAKGKIEELNQWLFKAKKEAEKNARFRNNLAEKVRIFNKAKEELETFEENIMNEIQEFNENELEKLKKEAKVHERNQKMMAGLPNKKERDEMEKMRNFLSSIKEEADIKHKRYKLNKERVSKLLEEAKGKKKELIKRIETLDLMTGKPEDSQKNIDLKKIPETNLDLKKIPETNLDSKKISKSDFLIGNQKDLESNQVDYTFNPEEFERITQQMENISKTPQLKHVDIKTDNQTSKPFQNPSKTPPKPPPSDSPSSKSIISEARISQASLPILPTHSSHSSHSSHSTLHERLQESNSERCDLPEYSEKIPLLDHKTFPDGRVLKLYESGHRETHYPNGTRKEEYPNGYSVLFYSNKDIKQVFPDGRTVYYYSEQSTSHTTYPDGSKLIRFSTGQTEKHLKDGSKKIKYLDGTVKKISPNGDQETIYPDSTLQVVLANGNSSIFHPGGHKEIQITGAKKRVYFNGTSKNIN
jgi:centromere protein J